METVKASPEYYFTLHATVTTSPYWGGYGGYHDVWQAIKSELAKIGINLEIAYYDDFTWWDRVWNSGWNKSWDEGGWDLTMSEWRMQPHALEPWFSSMVYSWLTPPEGHNIHPWNNSNADDLLWEGMTSFDAETRQYNIWKWQEEFMNDLPWVNIYYPRIYEPMGRWVGGYDPTGCWWYDISHLSLNVSAMPPARKLLHTDWAYYAVEEPVWTLLPLFIEERTEEQMTTIQWDTLYRWSLNWSKFEPGMEPDPADFIIVPALAASDPYPVDGDFTRMRVELRQGVKWSDYATSSETVDADDVVFSFNTLVLDQRAKSCRMGDFIWIIDRVEKNDTYTVDFILKEPCPDLKSVLANGRGSSIMPYHKLYQYEGNPSGLKTDPSNWAFDDPTKWLPVTGPFKLKEIVADQYVLLERNPLYFGFDESVVGSPAWGPDPSVQAIFLKTLPDPAIRLLEFKKYRLDFGEYPTAPIEVWKDMETDPYLRVFQYNYPASNPIWFNFNNEYLSNKYVRLAIAHAIPYERIFNEILPSWGIETAYPGKTYVLPVHHYTEPNTPEIDPNLTGSTVHLFNEELEPWHYNIDEALQYMYLWYSQEAGTPVASFTYEPLEPIVSETVTFNASASYDPNGTIVSYDWNFGDETVTTETEPIITHVYTNAGTYTVTLTVTDNEGLADTTSAAISVSPVEVHDIAVISVTASPTQVTAGELVYITVTALDKGDFPETFNVTAYYDETIIEVTEVTLNAGESAIQTFTWNTTGVPGGTHTIKAEATVVEGEVYTTDNILIDGMVTVTSPPVPAALSVYPPTSTALIGETFTVNVTIADVSNLFAWQFLMHFDPDVLQVNNVTEGSFLASTGEETDFIGPTINNEVGYVIVGCLFMPPLPEYGASGDGVLATITFLVEAFGTTSLSFDEDEALTLLRGVIWTDYNATPPVGYKHPIQRTLVDGFFDNRTPAPPYLSIKLSGEHDYALMENVEIQIVALVTDATSGSPVSDANVTIEIYDPNGILWVSDIIVERLIGSGIYEWKSGETIRQLRLQKGVYLVNAHASYQGGPTTTDVLQFHVDPPTGGPNQILYLIAFIVVALAGIVGLLLKRRQNANRLRQLNLHK